MPAGRIATTLDFDMLFLRGVQIFPPWASLDEIRGSLGPSGLTNLGTVLGGRCLLRYVARWQVGTLLNGTYDRTYATPTLYNPTEVSRWLSLPSPWARRRHLYVYPLTRFQH